MKDAAPIAGLLIAFTSGAVVTLLVARALAPKAVARAVLTEIERGSSLNGVPPEIRSLFGGVYRTAATNITERAVRDALTPWKR